MKQIDKNILNEKGSPRYRLGEAGMALQILILIIVIIGMAVGVFLVQRTQIFKSKATDSKTNSQVQTQSPVQEVKPDPQVESLTNELLKLDKQYDQTIQTNPNSSPKPQGGINNPDVKGEQTSAIERAQLNKMIDVAKKRKEMLIKKLEENPQDFLANANLVDQRDSLPEEVKEHVEERIDIKGKITLLHTDNFEAKTSEDQYFIEVNQNGKEQRYALFFFGEEPKLSPKSEVQLNTIAIDNNAAVTNIDNQTDQKVLGVSQQSNNGKSSKGSVLAAQAGDLGTLGILSAADSQPSLGNMKVAVIMIKQEDGDHSYFTKPIVEEMMTTDEYSFKNYFEAVSYGKLSLSFDVFEPVSLPIDICTRGQLEAKVEELITQQGINLDDYDQIAYIVATSYGHCLPFWEIDGSDGYKESWISVWKSADIVKTRNFTLMHEFGHSLGLPHANFLYCGGKPFKGGCTSMEYGDFLSIMGLGEAADGKNFPISFNAVEKVALEWIPSSEVVNVTNSGTYTIGPTEGSTTLPRILKVKSYHPKKHFYVSYKRPTGFDASLLKLRHPITGASIYIWDDSARDNSSYLIDTTPGSLTAELYYTPDRSDKLDGYLSDGSSFTHATSGVTVKQISHNDDSVTIEVTLTPPPVLNPLRVFVTSDKYSGDLGGLSGADTKCQALADDPDKNSATNDALGGLWKAWLSDRNTSAIDRIELQNGLYKLINGTIVIDNLDQLLDGVLSAPINIDQTGKEVSNQYVWTGTNTNGTFKRGFDYDCKSWTGGSDTTVDIDRFGTTGQTSKTVGWTSTGGNNCRFYNLPLYCFEEPGTVSPTPSPSPSPSGGIGTYTVSYKLAESPAELATASAKLYDKEPLGFDYVFKDPTPGAKFLFVEFKDNVGGLATRSAQIELVAPGASPSPSPSISPSPSPSPSPSASPVVPPPPAGGGGGGGGSGGGGGGGSSSGGNQQGARRIADFRYAEDPTALQRAEWKTYGQGIIVEYEFENSDPGEKFIFVQFRDQYKMIVKINGAEYATSSITLETDSPPSQGGTNPDPAPVGNTPEVIIGNISLSTSPGVSGSSGSWASVSINLSLSGFSSPGRSIAGLFVRNQTGECSINDCGYSGWTQIRSYGTNGTDATPWTASGDLSAGVHMFAAFSLNADGTAGQLLAVSKTNFGSSSTTTTTGGTDNGTSTSNACISLTQSPDNATSCSCTNSDSSAADFAGKCYTGTGQSNGQGGCNGGWCNGGKCQTCSP